MLDANVIGMPERWGFGRRLRNYVGLVAAETGVGLESCVIDPDPPASAYLALDCRASWLPDHELALLWDERFGWSMVAEHRAGDDPTVLGYLTGDVLPPPEDVRAFVAAVRTSERGGGPVNPPAPAGPDARRDVRERLHKYEP